MTQKENIKNKLKKLIRQYEKMGHNEYGQYVKRDIADFFSEDTELQEKALKSIQSILSIRLWDGFGFTSHNPRYLTYYKDEFIDNFNNFGEWYKFLQELVKDVEAYHKERLSSQS